jgi:5'(3')-deoxyribonucleotidase
MEAIEKSFKCLTHYSGHFVKDAIYKGEESKNYKGYWKMLTGSLIEVFVKEGLLFDSNNWQEVKSDPVEDYILFPNDKTVVAGEDKHKGLRFNKGKVRYDLLHPIATEGIARVMTKGSLKYAERNWENGMLWSNVLASMKRHTAAFEQGVDYDIDPKCEGCKNSTKENWVCKNHTGELHVDLIQTNAHFLSAYYKIYPQGDDRPHNYLKTPRIGLDIDEVLCDWVGEWTKKNGLDTPTNWSFDADMLDRFEDLKNKGELDNFYLSLQPLIKPEDIPFEPYCYITSRPVSSEVTAKWLSLFGFPARPVFTTTKGMGKVEIAKREGIDIFVDDAFHNFVDLNKAGICCFLMDAKHNQRYEVGFKRIKTLKDLTW